MPQFMEPKEQLVTFQKFTQSFLSKKNNSKCTETKVKKGFSSLARKKGRPNLAEDEMLQKMRDVITGSHLAVTIISRKMVIAIGPSVIKDNQPKLLKEFGRSLNEGWAQNILKNMYWVKRKEITGKIKPYVKF